ncbi:MAG TPA: hypothetical protein DEQ74_02200 [Wolbachia sp.]|uniref:hypothetical protein n=1 Tax=Wolbachia endosymbiont of Pentalonia nigronervosa TaxID=1301914 RepID=UPI000EC84E5A|nr:hypothetical protein [Wolbachia endosymbiont of Pentalonia nigronervosa]MBD0391208.1 hypothetical protein [Wolbachia endosymbiont of Pentalonia nigronervosa]HCE59621.1 hypothetical protein [Wolbachia sp.]
MPNLVKRLVNKKLVNEGLINALVKAFNINNYTYNTYTNFTTEYATDNKGYITEGYITMAFDDNMNKGQCVNYLQKLREKAFNKFYSGEVGAATSFNLDYFPFDCDGKYIVLAKEAGRLKLRVLITPEVISNLQAHLALSMSKDIEVKIDGKIMPKERDEDKCDKYITGSSFESAALAQKFADQFNTKVQKIKDFTPGGRYSASGCVRVKGNDTYVTRSIFNDANFVQDYAEEYIWRVGRTFESPSANDGIGMLKNALFRFIRHATGINIRYCDHVSYVFPVLEGGRKEYSILVPGVEDKDGLRYLNEKEVALINSVFRSSKFNFNILHDVSTCIEKKDLSTTQKTIDAVGKNGIYGIDLYNEDVSICALDTIFSNSRVTQVGNEYKLEVQSSPHIDKSQAQRQEALLRIQEIILRASTAQSHAETAQSHAIEAQRCANMTILHTELVQLSAEAARLRVDEINLRAESAKWYAEASRLHAEIAQSTEEEAHYLAEETHFHAKEMQFRVEVVKLRQEINEKDKEKKQNPSRCNPNDRSKWGSIDSSSSDDNDRNINHDPAAKPPIANRLSTAAQSSSDNFGNKKGQGQSDSGQGRIPTPPPFPVDKPDHLHLPLGQQNSNSSTSSGYDSNGPKTAEHKQLNVILSSDTTDSGHSSRNSTLLRGSTPPRSGTSSTADKYKQKKSLLSRIFSFLGRKDRPEEDPYQHSISDASASSIVSKDSAISLRSQNNTVMTQGKDSVQSKLSNLQVERGNVGEKEVDVVF